MLARLYTLVIGLLLTSALQAASLSSADLPEGSNWYLHVNVALMRQSTIGQMFLAESIGEAMEDIQDEIGVPLEDQIEGVTVFGGEIPPDSGAVVLHGNLAPTTTDALLARMREEGTLTQYEHAGLVYYGLSEPDAGAGKAEDRDGGIQLNGDDEFLVAFGNGQTMVSERHEAIQRFLAAGGHLSGLKSADPAALVVIEADRALVQGGMNNETAKAAGNWDSSVLSNVNRVAAVLTDENGAASFHADITATSPQIAESVRNVVEGLVALKALDTADEPAIGALLNATKIDTDGANITVDVFLDPILLDQLRALSPS